MDLKTAVLRTPNLRDTQDVIRERKRAGDRIFSIVCGKQEMGKVDEVFAVEAK